MKFQTVFPKMSLLAGLLAMALTACQAAASTPAAQPTAAQPPAATAQPTAAPTAAVEATAPADTSDTNATMGDALPAGGLDACALLTEADAQAALGKPVKLTDPLVNGEGLGVVTSCRYRAVDEVTLSVSLIVRRLDTSDYASKLYAQTEKDMVTQLAVTPEDIAGVGEAAFWLGDIYNQLYALKGNVHLLLDVSNQKAPNDTVKGLMTQIIQRLP